MKTNSGEHPGCQLLQALIGGAQNDHSWTLHRWLKIELHGNSGQVPIKTDQCATSFASSEVERIGKVHSLPVPLQGSPHELFLLKMEMANSQQPLKRRDHRLKRQPVGPTQHPFQLQHHGDRHKTSGACIDQGCRLICLSLSSFTSRRTSTLVSSATGKLMLR